MDHTNASGSVSNLVADMLETLERATDKWAELRGTGEAFEYGTANAARLLVEQFPGTPPALADGVASVWFKNHTTVTTRRGPGGGCILRSELSDKGGDKAKAPAKVRTAPRIPGING